MNWNTSLHSHANNNNRIAVCCSTRLELMHDCHNRSVESSLVRSFKSWQDLTSHTNNSSSCKILSSKSWHQAWLSAILATVMIVLVASFFNFNAKLVNEGKMFWGLKFCGHNCDWLIKHGMSESLTKKRNRIVLVREN